jgi:hypothetical protein
LPLLVLRSFHQQLRQLGDVGGDAARLIAGHTPTAAVGP